MKKYIAVFVVPDDFTPADFRSNADGWFVDKSEDKHLVEGKLKYYGDAKKHYCKECEYLSDERSSIGNRCTNKNRKTVTSRFHTNEFKYPTCPACKTGFKPKEVKCETVSLSQPVEEHS